MTGSEERTTRGSRDVMSVQPEGTEEGRTLGPVYDKGDDSYEEGRTLGPVYDKGDDSYEEVDRTEPD